LEPILSFVFVLGHNRMSLGLEGHTEIISMCGGGGGGGGGDDDDDDDWTHRQKAAELTPIIHEEI
jgi:hypothetical protein